MCFILWKYMINELIRVHVTVLGCPPMHRRCKYKLRYDFWKLSGRPQNNTKQECTAELTLKCPCRPKGRGDTPQLLRRRNWIQAQATLNLRAPTRQESPNTLQDGSHLVRKLYPENIYGFYIMVLYKNHTSWTLPHVSIDGRNQLTISVPQHKSKPAICHSL